MSASEEDIGGLSLGGFPMTSCFVDMLPLEITLSVVVAVCALAGDEFAPTLYLTADAPSGERVSTMEFHWQWPDYDDVPVKYRAFVQYLPLYLESEGTHLLSLRHSPAGESVADFPLPVYLNPEA